jgi:hypothetical protein
MVSDLRSLKQPHRRLPRRALSMIEVVASTMIVGMMCVAALNSLGAATRSSESIGNRAVAIGLANELMAEIVQLPYSDPVQSPVFGRESGEPATGPRSSFDDVDDYNGWNASPPQYRSGQNMLQRENWRHRVEVTRVSPTNPSQTVGTDQGAKQIRVTVEYHNPILDEPKTLAEQISVQTDAD